VQALAGRIVTRRVIAGSMRKSLIELASTITGRAISASGVLVISVVLSRQLSLPEAGGFFFAFTLLMGLAIFARVGQELRLIRAVAWRSKASEGRADLAASLEVVTVASLAVSAPFAVAWLIVPEPSPLTLIWLALLPTAMTNLTASYFKGRGDNSLGALSEVGSVSLVASAGYLVFPPQSATEAWMVLSAASWLVAGGWLAVAIGRRRLTARRVGAWRALVRDSRHLWSVAVLSYVAQWGVLVIVMLAMTQDAVAILNALLRLLAPLQFVVLSLDLFLAPRFARKSPDEIIRARRRGITACLSLAAPYALVLLLWPDRVLATLYGQAYGGFGLELQILVAGILIQMVFGANGVLLNMLSEDRAMTASVLLRTLAAIVLPLALFFVPSLSIACLALSVSLVIQTLYLRHRAAIALGRRRPA
jgi:O-antigen/teichoic acid export membrane protein